MKVQIRNISFGNTHETMLIANAEVFEILENLEGNKSIGSVVFKGTLEDCKTFADKHERVMLVDTMNLSAIPKGRTPSKKRTKNASARASHWKKTGVSDATVRWMEDHDML